MALILHNIYNQTKQKFKLQLIAGEGGLKNCMRWVYVSEDYTTSDFLHGGELIITTGVISGGSSDWLMHMLHRIIKQNACGLIINEGPYLNRNQISKEVLDFCNENNFPLFLMPWHIHIYDITRDYCDRIFTDTRQNEAICEAFLTLLNNETESSKAIDLLTDYGFSQEDLYYIVQLQSSSRINLIIKDLIQSFLFEYSVFMLEKNQSFILIFYSYQLNDVQQIIKKLQDLIKTCLSNCNIFSGISGQIKSLNMLSKGLEQAQSALSWYKSLNISIGCYDDMGFFRLLLEIKNREFLKNYVNEQLGAVIKYDENHKSDFLQTLYLYLIHKGSIQEIAADSFFHRNTISHRLYLLRNKLGYKLDDSKVCFELLVAFQIKEFLDSIGHLF